MGRPQISDPGRVLSDRYVSPAGDDSNDGTRSAPWRTFAKAVTWVNALPSDSFARLAVLSGSYTEQNNGLYFGNANNNVKIVVEFAAGVTATTSQVGGTGGNGIGASGSMNVTFNLRGAQFTGTTTGSANGIGTHSTAQVIVNGGGALFTGYEDGWSSHDNSYFEGYDITFADCGKGAFTPVTNSTFKVVRCTHVGRSGATLGIGAVQNATFGTFEDCIFIPAANAQTMTIINNTILNRCQIGTPSLTVNVNPDSQTTSEFNDCYLNARFNGLGYRKFRRCFGRFSTNVRGLTAATPLIENCVFVGGTNANTQFCNAANGYTANSFDPGSLTIRNSIFTGYASFLDMATGVTTTIRDQLKNAINSQWTMQGVCINGVTTVMSPATISLPSPYVTANPLLANPTTTAQSDYNTAANSPCRGAGVAGANIGLPV